MESLAPEPAGIDRQRKPMGRLMTMKFKWMALAVVATTLAGCAGGTPDLEGKWRDVAEPELGFDIQRHESRYRITMATGILKGLTMGATFEEGALQLTDPHLGCTTLFYDAKNDSIDVCGQMTLQRAD